jgi:hypothetical protein
LIHLVVCGVDIDGLDVPAAARVVEQCAEAERVLAALRVMTAARLEGAAVWRGEGFRSVAAWMAAKTGTAVGPAIDAVEMAGQLADLPVVADAFRSGQLSVSQAVEIVDVASEAPEVQGQLVEAAGKLSLRGLREECRRVKASVIIDEDDRHQVGHLSATMTPDALAQVMNAIDGRADDIVEDGIRGGWFERYEAHRVDALLDLLRPDDGTGPAGPEHMVHVVVDDDAVVRGQRDPRVRAGAGVGGPADGRGRNTESHPHPRCRRRRRGPRRPHDSGPRPQRPRSAIPSASCPAATSAGTSRSTIATPGAGRRSPISTTSPDSARITTTRRRSSVTPTEEGLARGGGFHRPIGTRICPPSAGSSPAPVAADRPFRGPGCRGARGRSGRALRRAGHSTRSGTASGGRHFRCRHRPRRALPGRRSS